MADSAPAPTTETAAPAAAPPAAAAAAPAAAAAAPAASDATAAAEEKPLEARFQEAYDSVKGWTPTNGEPSNEEKLKMYALAKQANVGDVNTSRPGMFDFTGKAKWDAWDKMKGKGKDEAMQEYVDELMRQKGVYGDAAKAGSG